jgi:hypothetical protein
MKRAIAVVAILVFSLIIGSNHMYAQMMGNGSMMNNNQAQTSRTKQQAPEQMTDTSLTNMMNKSTAMSTTMMKDFEHLQNRFNAVMKTDNMQTLKADMEGLQSMMTSIQREMSNEMQMQQRMNSMMHSGDMHGDVMMHSGMMGMTRDGKSEPANPNPNSDVK